MIKVLLGVLKKLIIGGDLTPEQKKAALNGLGIIAKAIAEGAAKGAAEGLKK